MKRPNSIIEIFLQPGEFYFGESDTRIRTILGSCVSITMWHPQLRIGGMCHYMLASKPGRRGKRLDGKYGDDAVMMFLDAAARNNTDPHDYVFKIFGGGKMFLENNDHRPCEGSTCELMIDRCFNVSCKNANIGRALLKRHGLNVVAEHLGGDGHRNVIFDIWSGSVWVRQSPLAAQVG